MAEFVWMQHTEHDGKAKFAAAAVDDWKAKGWAECEPAPEPDIYHDPQPALETPAPAGKTTTKESKEK